MYDSFNRKINYLRFSVTDRCDLRCQYCMPKKMKFSEKKDSLTLLEMKKIMEIFLKLGFEKVKITGGEPLVRKDIIKFLEFLNSKLKKKLLKEISLTTNGNLLETHINRICENGVSRINISLDSLIDEKYAFITNGGSLSRVLSGIYSAKNKGIRVKINTVLLKNFNEDEILNLVEWCSVNNFDISFIEIMPLGKIEMSRDNQYLPVSVAFNEIEKKYKLKKSFYKTSGPSKYFMNDSLNSKIGFISPISNNFCESCNRVRVTSNGKLFNCLGYDDSNDLKKIIKQNFNIQCKKISEIIFKKPEKHFFDISKNMPETERHMNLTGG